MSKMYKILLAIFIFSSISFQVSAQQKSWSVHNAASGTITTDKAVARLSFPKEFKLFDLDIAPLKQALFSITDNQAKHSTVITLPNADGGTEQFEVFEASNFEPALQARFPEIRAFSGRGITDKYATLKLSISPQGVQTMVFRTDKPDEFIEPYSRDHSVYAVFKSQREKGKLPWACTTEDKKMAIDLNSKIPIINGVSSSAGQLKTMRLAQSVTAEYSNYFGATSAAQVALVLAGINATLTRCNGCYEKDLAVHLNLIAQTTDVIFYDPATDPYSPGATGAAGAWNAQLQNTLTSIIGEANYDIGHLFGASGGGGNAGCIGCVCVNGQKGSGFTSPADNIPQGDNFDIDYVVHEVGHQMGANHTFSMSLEGTGVNKEVGSGITIMGYAGITAQDVAPHSIDIYHEASIEQIQNNLATKSCPITTSITANNATPVVAPVSNFTIPISTPFVLTGSATDANAGDVLTYCWEQNDNSTTSGNNSVASPTKTTGPNWLSFSPTVSPSRSFPKLSTILAGLNVTPALPGGDAIANIEALSSVARTLNFRLTVRDNSPYVSSGAIKVGQTAYTDMVVTVAAAGPFNVTSPNTAVSWPGGTSQTITWSVNGTDAAPISVSNVKISLSTDGGQTYPTVLAASTPNDGTESLVIPNTPTTTARVKVEAIGNIFFDVSNTNFSIVIPPNDFAFTATAPTTVACPAVPNPTVTIPTTVTGTFVTPIVLAATAGVPAGTTVTFAPNPLTPGSSAVATLNNANTLIAGTYAITVTGTAGANVHNTTITYIISAGTPPVITTQPASQAVCAPATATFTVASSTAGVSYKWQSATAAAPTVFSDIPGATSATYTTGATTGLNGTVYHVIVYTQCSTITSANATLTVNTAAAITTQPTNQQACTGNTATFTVGATGTGVTYQWQSAATSGGTYTNVSTGTGGTTATYTTAALTVTTDRFYHVIVTTTTCAGTVTSNEVTLTTSVTTAINTQPTAQVVCAPTAATFTVAAVGTNLTYQWQVSVAGGPYTNVTTGTGGTTASYNTGATTGAMSGNSYHVVVTGTCNVVTSSNVTLTVNTAPVITTAPTAVVICSGNPTAFTVVATGTNLTYQWQSATALAGPYTNIPSATSATYAIASTTAAMSGTYYQVVITGTCTPAVTSAPVLLTVNSPVVITTQPVDASVCFVAAGPNNTSFGVAATGTAVTYQWQISIDGGATFNNLTNAAPYSGATTNTLSLTGVTLTMTTYKYRVLVSGTCTPAGTLSNVVTLTVLNPVVIDKNPDSVRTCVGANVSFTVLASGSALSYQWQLSNDGVTYGNVPNAAPYSGTTSATLTITNVTTFYNNFRYRAVVTGTPCGVKTTLPGLLTVNNNPVAVLTVASNSNINPSIPAVLYTTVSPAGSTYTYQYKRNGVVAPGLTTATVPLSVDLFGTYQVTVTNTVTGCSGTSNIVTVADSASSRLFVYPNPNKGVFQVRYYNKGGATTSRTLSVYDNKGGRVYTKAYPTTAIYERMDVNVSGYSAGLYFIELRDANGKLLATGKVKKD